MSFLCFSETGLFGRHDIQIETDSVATQGRKALMARLAAGQGPRGLGAPKGTDDSRERDA